jgi:hypothetical protein
VTDRPVPGKARATTTLGRDESHREATLPRIDRQLAGGVRRDIAAPPPMLLLPLRLEYRVFERAVPVRLAANVAAMFANDRDVVLEQRVDPQRAATIRRERVAETAAAPPARDWHLDATRATFTTRREIWFRWYPEEDFSLHGVAPISPAEADALSRFDEARGSKAWYELDDPAVISAWQSLSREVAPERALHLIRHRADPGDANYLDKLGRIALLPERVGLFAVDDHGVVSALAQGAAIDPQLRYSIANVQQAGWHTDFDAAIAAGMGLRIADDTVVQRALDAAWIVAVGLNGADASAAVAELIDDAVANGAFAFLRQDTPTNNTPQEPTPYQAPRADLVAFLRTAADAERGVLASPLAQSAEVFAEALGLDVGHVATAPNSGDLAFEDARAMLHVVGPALIDTAVDHVAALAGISEEAIIDLFAEAIVARGPLPPVRFGKNPYGVLPIVHLESLTPLGSDAQTEQTVEAFVRTFAEVLGAQAEAAADATVPVLHPGDPNAAATLETILKLNPVSRRVDVGTQGQSDFRGLGCPYVTGPVRPAAAYLADLAQQRIAALPDPTAGDTDYPLLYRLARLTLAKTVLNSATADPGLAGIALSTRIAFTPEERARVDRATTNVTSRPLSSLAVSAIPGFGGSRADALRTASGRFLAGLQRLQAIANEPDGIPRLETLLMETIDLFQNRIDAWATGIAYRRLVKRRRAGRDGLTGGYWGMLGRLRRASVTGGTDGFLQAPSPHQAVTAAILRSAHLRHADTGAFAIGLDSARVRRGLELLDTLQAGISPAEALGYIAERKLHDRHQDILIFALRDKFPLRDPRDDSAIETNLHDGLAFMNANVAAVFPADDVPALEALHRELREVFDALADVVLAEAAHLRGMGQADAANAWLQVLSGETIPGIPSVLRTRRNGHGSTHRVAVLLEPPGAPPPGAGPREVAEPVFAAFVDGRLAGFDTALVEVSIQRADGSGVDTTQFRLAGDLGMRPIDLLIGGEAEVLLRARHHLVDRWRTDNATQTALGPLPDRGLVTFINRTRPVTVDLDAGSTSVRTLLNTAGELRRAATLGRNLEPSDLSAAADPAVKLTDDVERDLLVGSATALEGRAAALSAAIAADTAALRAAGAPVVAAARNCRRLMDAQADEAMTALAILGLEALRPALDASLLAVSHYAEPGALRLMTTADMIADPDDLERFLNALAGKLAAKAARLDSAASAGAPAVAREARALRDAFVAALRFALDGDALRLFPPIARVGATTPLLDPNPPRVAPALAEWSPVRAKVRRVATLFADAAWDAYQTSAAATGADQPDADERADEGIAPRARLFGTFVAENDPAAAGSFTGFVADEWAERRPSRLQQTGIAVNYDSPQSEPPHVLLLCEPSGPDAPAWSPDAAAAMVAETIGLMKQRALAAQDRAVGGPLLPFANQVPFEQQGDGTSEARIPVKKFKPVPGGAVHFDGEFVVDQTSRDVGPSGRGVSEISGFSKVRE